MILMVMPSTNTLNQPLIDIAVKNWSRLILADTLSRDNHDVDQVLIKGRLKNIGRHSIVHVVEKLFTLCL